MSPIAESPPAIWQAPVAPLRIVRAFHLGPAYAAGGHRGIDLRTSPGDTVRAPCDGKVAFRGTVAGGPPTVTIRCGELRATLQRVRPSGALGSVVAAGTPVGIATGSAIDLSARRADDEYLDPAGLLRAATVPVPPPVLPRRPATPGSRAQRPARVADRALVNSQRAGSAVARATASRGSVDLPLGLAGAGLGASAVLALTLSAVRRRRPGLGQVAQALRPRAQR